MRIAPRGPSSSALLRGGLLASTLGVGTAIASDPPTAPTAEAEVAVISLTEVNASARSRSRPKGSATGGWPSRS